MIMGIAQEDIKKGDSIYLEPANGKVYLVSFTHTPKSGTEISRIMDESFEKWKDENCVSGNGYVS